MCIRALGREVGSLLFVLVLAVGCASGGGGNKTPPPPNSKAAKLILDGIPDYTVVSKLKMDPSGKYLRVQAQLSNLSSGIDQIFYRFHWYDTSGMEVGPEEGWKTMPILDNAQISLEGVAVSKSAVDFKLELQSPNSSRR